MDRKKPPATPVRKRRRLTAQERKDRQREALARVHKGMVDLESVRAKAKAANDEAKPIQDSLLNDLAEAGVTTTTHKVGGDVYSATKVEGTSVVIDEEKLRKRLGSQLWNKVTTRSLDRKKLDAFLASGEVRISDVAACSDETPRTPFVKVSKKSAS